MNDNKIAEVAEQLIEVGSRIVSISNVSEMTEMYADMLYDNVSHAQKLVVEITKLTLGESEETSETNGDSVFFEGELTDNLNEEKEE